MSFTVKTVSQPLFTSYGNFYGQALFDITSDSSARTFKVSLKGVAAYYNYEWNFRVFVKGWINSKNSSSGATNYSGQIAASGDKTYSGWLPKDGSYQSMGNVSRTFDYNSDGSAPSVYIYLECGNPDVYWISEKKQVTALTKTTKEVTNQVPTIGPDYKPPTAPSIKINAQSQGVNSISATFTAGSFGTKNYQYKKSSESSWQSYTSGKAVPINANDNNATIQFWGRMDDPRGNGPGVYSDSVKMLYYGNLAAPNISYASDNSSLDNWNKWNATLTAPGNATNNTVTGAWWCSTIGNDSTPFGPWNEIALSAGQTHNISGTISRDKNGQTVYLKTQTRGSVKNSSESSWFRLIAKYHDKLCPPKAEIQSDLQDNSRTIIISKDMPLYNQILNNKGIIVYECTHNGKTIKGRAANDSATNCAVKVPITADGPITVKAYLESTYSVNSNHNLSNSSVLETSYNALYYTANKPVILNSVDNGNNSFTIKFQPSQVGQHNAVTGYEIIYEDYAGAHTIPYQSNVYNYTIQFVPDSCKTPIKIKVRPLNRAALTTDFAQQSLQLTYKYTPLKQPIQTLKGDHTDQYLWNTWTLDITAPQDELYNTVQNVYYRYAIGGDPANPTYGQWIPIGLTANQKKTVQNEILKEHNNQVVYVEVYAEGSNLNSPVTNKNSIALVFHERVGTPGISLRLKEDSNGNIIPNEGTLTVTHPSPVLNNKVLESFYSISIPDGQNPIEGRFPIETSSVDIPLKWSLGTQGQDELLINIKTNSVSIYNHSKANSNISMGGRFVKYVSANSPVEISAKDDNKNTVIFSFTESVVGHNNKIENYDIAYQVGNSQDWIPINYIENQYSYSIPILSKYTTITPIKIRVRPTSISPNLLTDFTTVSLNMIYHGLCTNPKISAIDLGNDYFKITCTQGEAGINNAIKKQIFEYRIGNGTWIEIPLEQEKEFIIVKHFTKADNNEKLQTRTQIFGEFLDGPLINGIPVTLLYKHCVLYIKENGVFQPKHLKVKDNNQWKDVELIWTKQNGQWVQATSHL